MYNIEAMLQKAIVATKNNHPDSDMGLTISSAIAEYINNRSNNNLELDNLKTFCMYFSKKNYSTNEEIRNPLMTSFFQTQRDVAIYIFKLLYSFSIKEISKEPTDEKYAASLLRYIDSFAKLKSTFDSIDIENEIAKNSIYRNTVLLKDVLDNSKPILEQYVNNVLLEAEKTINLRNVVISNIEDLSSFSLKESLDYNYVYGNLEINMSTRKGYTYIPKKEGVVKDQEDAILSISRDGCSLNVVADGAGGHEMGQIASSMVIDGLKNWFNSLDLSKYNTVIDDKKEIINISSTLNREIEEKLKDISEEIVNINPECLSTVVLAFITPSFISFVNAGDSTGYVYDKDKDKIILMSTIHSPTSHLSYEEARKNERNNEITSFVGKFGRNIWISSKICFNNGNKRILLSSDGVTDLISEDNFIKTIKGNYSLKQIVEKAEKNPDVDLSFPKLEDNISGIMIDINNKRGL